MEVLTWIASTLFLVTTIMTVVQHVMIDPRNVVLNERYVLPALCVVLIPVNQFMDHSVPWVSVGLLATAVVFFCRSVWLFRIMPPRDVSR